MLYSANAMYMRRIMANLVLAFGNRISCSTDHSAGLPTQSSTGGKSWPSRNARLVPLQLLAYYVLAICYSVGLAGFELAVVVMLYSTLAVLGLVVDIVEYPALDLGCYVVSSKTCSATSAR
jgi:hypothetical protein